VGLVRTAVSGVLTATRYRNIEVLIVDNGSVEEETLRYFARVSGNPRVRIIRHDAPFNYSQLNNVAAREAKGSHLLLLNNDVEIVDENWLTWLVRQAVRPGVGAVGALLTYDDGSVSTRA
jgi:GT2 family glycosyltransferase